MAGVVVIDSNSIVALYESQNEHHSWALEMFQNTVGMKLLTSALNYADVVMQPNLESQIEKFELSISKLGLMIEDFTGEVALSVAKLRAKYFLSALSACVLQTALEHSGAVATTDKRLASAARELKIPVYQP